MSDTNRVLLAYVEETTFGVTPSGPAPTLQNMRYTGESLIQATDFVQSQEIRSDRQIPDHVRTGVRAEGDINLELSYGAYDDLLRAALQSAAWTSEVSVDSADTGISAAASDDSFNHTTAWANDPAAGDIIKVSGFTTNASNNGYFRVVSATSSKIIVNRPLTDESAGDAVTIENLSQITNGTTQLSYSIEKSFLDLSNIFEVLVGMTVNGLSLNVQPDQIITGNFSFMGKSAASGTSTVGDGSNTAAPTNDVMNAIDHINAVVEGGADYDITQFGLELNNNLRARLQVGTLGAVSIGAGTAEITGVVQAYFNDAAVMNKYLNAAETELFIVAEDAAGNAYVIDLPAVKYTSGQRVAGGINQDVIADMQYAAKLSATYGHTIRIARNPA